MPADHLFVYGTLRRGCNNKFARLLAERAEFVGHARVRGVLYDLSEYPGAQPSPESNEWIIGELFRFSDPELLKMLDDYEGPEFERKRTTAHAEDADEVDCWIYWYIGPTVGSVIASGDWLQR